MMGGRVYFSSMVVDINKGEKYVVLRKIFDVVRVCVCVVFQMVQ